MTPRRLTPAWLLAGLVMVASLAGGGLWWWSLGTAAVPVLPERGDLPREPSGAPESMGGDASASMAPPAERSATAIPGVFGRVLDAAGQPVAGASIAVRQLGGATPSEGTVSVNGPSFVIGGETYASSDGDGRFAFPRLAAADYAVRLVAGDSLEKVTLAAGEHREVELRQPAGGVLLTGVVTRRGEPFARCELWFVARAGGAKQAIADEAGRFLAFVPSGEVEVLVQGRQRLVPFPVFDPAGLTLAKETLYLPPDVPRREVRIDAVTVQVELTIGPDTRPVPDLRFEVEELDAPGKPHRFAAKSGDGRTGTITDLPLGRWQVRPVAQTLAEIAARQLEATASEGVVEVRFDLPATGDVRLEFRDAAGRIVRLDADLLPALPCAGGDVPCLDLDRGHGSAVTGGRPSYCGVPVGTVTLHFDDVRTADSVRFLPFAPLPPRDVAVAAGGETIVELQVEPRVVVELRATEASGRENPMAAIEVFDGGRTVAPEGQPQRSRWTAHLPPGLYRVVITDAQGVREDAVTVGREPLRREFRR